MGTLGDSNPVILPVGSSLSIQLTGTATLNITGPISLVPAPNGTIRGGSLVLNGKVAFSLSDASVDVAAFLPLLGNPVAAIEFVLKGNDTLTGSNVALPVVTDHLKAGAGNDAIQGLGGKDVIDGGTGAFDTAVYSEKTLGILVTLGAVGVVTQQKTGVAGIVGKTAIGGVVEDLVSNIENVACGKGNDFVSGNALSNRLSGNLGNDTLRGLGGNDVLQGDAGADYLDGGVGIDVINGGIGNDTINGGLGNDRLTGGLGGDKFVFNTAIPKAGVNTTNVDIITDFNLNDDQFRLENVIYTGLNPGNVPAAAFKLIGAGPIDANDRVFYNKATGDVFWDGDGSSAVRTMIQFAHLDKFNGVFPTLTEKDFFVT